MLVTVIKCILFLISWPTGTATTSFCATLQTRNRKATGINGSVFLMSVVFIFKMFLFSIRMLFGEGEG